MVKQAGEKVEEARITLRNVRQDALKEAKRKKDSKELTEDDVKRVEKEIDSLMSTYNQKLEMTFKDKEKDILTI
jgi:ribosome recycling factor